MKKLLALSLCLGMTSLVGCSSVSQSMAISPTLPHPIVGAWIPKIENDHCSESYEFDANGGLRSRQGETRISASYHISNKPSKNGFYRLKDSSASVIASGRCSLSEQLDEHVFVMFNQQQNELILCSNESFDNCVGPLKKLSRSSGVIKHI